MAGINHVSGNICSFKTELARPLVGMKCHFTPVQADGTPAPDNVLPITGWADLNVIQSKKNLIPTDSPSNPEYNYKCTGDTHVIYDSTAGGYTESGTVGVAYFTHWYKLNGQTIPGNGYSKIFQTPTATTVTLSMEWKHNGVSTCGNTWPIRINKTLTGNSSSGLISNVRASEDPIDWTRIEFVVNLAAGEAINILMYRGVWWRNLQVEVGSVATAYEDANCNVYPVTWSSQGTVYGGWVNPISGEVWAEWVKEKLASYDFNNYSGKQYYYISLFNQRDGNSNIYSDTLTPKYTGGFLKMDIGDIYYYQNGQYSGNIFVKLPEPMEKTDANAWIKNTYPDAEICYKLATPILVGTISPIQLNTLHDQNNIWCNTNGITEVDYLDRSGPMSTYRRNIIMNSPHDMEGSGWMAKFTTDMRAPLKSMRCYFNPVQDAGVPSPDNVLPISGHTGLSVYSRNENLLNLNVQEGYAYPVASADTTPRTFDMNTYIVGMSPQNYYRRNYANYCTNVSVSSSGVSFTSGGASGYGIAFPIFLIPGYTYTLQTTCTATGNIGMSFYDRDGNRISSQQWSGVSARTATVPGNAWVTLVIFYANATNSDCSFTNIRLSKGTGGIDYVKSEGDYAEVDWSAAGTLYGGWCDPLTGTGEIIYKHMRLVGNENWYVEENSSDISNASYLCSIRVEPIGYNSGVYRPAITDKLAQSTYWAPDLYCATINTTSRFVIGLPQELSTKEAINNWIQSLGGIDVVWESQFPTPFTFTPISQLKASRNQNNIWHSANGQTECRFWAHKGTDDSTLLTNSDGAYIVTSDGMYVLVG